MDLHCKKEFLDCKLKSTDQVIRSISPSAYVVFKDVAATNDCGLIGSAIASTMVAFAPSDLLMGEQAEDGTPIDYAQIPSSCPSSAPSYSADSYNLCFPSLVMPLQVFDMNPAWKNCNGDPTRGWILSGIMDPPRALIPTAALAPSPTKISNPSLSAAPASALLPPLAPVTDLPINSLPSPASKAQLVPENAEPTASHRIGDSNVLPQVDSPSQTIIESSSIQSQPRDSTQPPLSPDPQSGRDQPNLPLHNNGDPAKQASYVDPPPSPTGDGIGRLVSLQPLNNNDWGKGEPLNPATGSQPQQKPVLTLAGITYAADTASHFVIAGETLAPGSSINPFGTPVYLASDGVVAAVGSDLVKQTLITPISVQSTGRLIIAGATYTADSASHFIIAGQTLSQGGVITVSRTRIFLAIGGANAIVGTSTQVLVPISQELMLTFGGSLYTADAPSAFSIGSQVLTPGGAITISNTPVSLFPGGTIAVEGTNSQLLASIASPTPAPVLTLNAMPYTADQFSAFTIQGQTLTPGGSIIVSGTQISLAVGGNFAAIGTSIQLLTPAESTTKASVLTFEGTTYIADASSAFAIDVQALTTGGVITVDGTPLSLDIEGTAAIIGSSTQMLGTATITGSIAATIHLGAQTYTENTSGEFIISGQTLAKGGEITVSGTPVSFEGGGTGVVIGSSTEAVGVGGWIMSGLGPGAAPTGVMHFEGKGLKRRMNLKRVCGMMIAVEFCMLMN